MSDLFIAFLYIINRKYSVLLHILKYISAAQKMYDRSDEQEKFPLVHFSVHIPMLVGGLKSNKICLCMKVFRAR